ncbi:hypothetical protein ACFS27_13745 [Promicromonospora vindobonensis]|uniref:Uncharacterized protein n=1 Tax=Promicromonospora vindobonensis TaxID=195748 RepID=A0ABW5VVR4_9MICO
MTSFNGRSQRLKPCAGGCGRKTRAVHCRECFAKIPARERAGAFGRFQLRQSHLVTVTDGDVDVDVLPSITPARAASARLTIAELAVRNTDTDAAAVAATREVINMLEIADSAGQETTG